MNQLQTTQPQEEWLRVLGKGMITIPKLWREDLNLTPGKIVKAKKEGAKVILEAQEESVPYRMYSASEINEFLKDDMLPKK